MRSRLLVRRINAHKCTCWGDCDLNVDPTAPAGKPEPTQIVVVHKALRRELSLLPSVVGVAAANDL